MSLPERVGKQAKPSPTTVLGRVSAHHYHHHNHRYTTYAETGRHLIHQYRFWLLPSHNTVCHNPTKPSNTHPLTTSLSQGYTELRVRQQTDLLPSNNQPPLSRAHPERTHLSLQATTFPNVPCPIVFVTSSEYEWGRGRDHMQRRSACNYVHAATSYSPPPNTAREMR